VTYFMAGVCQLEARQTHLQGMEALLEKWLGSGHNTFDVLQRIAHCQHGVYHEHVRTYSSHKALHDDIHRIFAIHANASSTLDITYTHSGTTATYLVMYPERAESRDPIPDYGTFTSLS
jgi:hypothetical protein